MATVIAIVLLSLAVIGLTVSLGTYVGRAHWYRDLLIDEQSAHQATRQKLVKAQMYEGAGLLEWRPNVNHKPGEDPEYGHVRLYERGGPVLKYLFTRAAIAVADERTVKQPEDIRQ